MRNWQDKQSAIQTEVARENLPKVQAVKLKVETKTKRRWKEATKNITKRIKAEQDQQQNNNRSELIRKANDYLKSSQ